MQFTFDQKRIDYIVGVLVTRPWGEVNETLQDIGTQLQQQQRTQPPLAVPPLEAKGNGAALAEAP